MTSRMPTIKLTDNQIKEIGYADLIYRSVDLYQLALNIETEILNNTSCLFSFLPISPDIGIFNEIKRVIINRTVNEDKSNARLNLIENLKYPPSKYKSRLGYNRASLKGQSIFYGGFGDFQGLFENPPTRGDIFTVSSWQQIKNKELCYASIFHDSKVQVHTDDYKNDWDHYIEQLSCLDNKTRNALEKLFSLITFFFTRSINPNKSIEYLYSAHIADRIFNLEYRPRIEAILYPSVPMKFIASNIAILPDSFDDKFTFCKADEYIVLQNEVGKNQWIYQKLGEATVSKNGKLTWSDC